LGRYVLSDFYKKPVEFIFYRLFLFPLQYHLKSPRLISHRDPLSTPFHIVKKNIIDSRVSFILFLFCFLSLKLATPAYPFENISLKEYEIKATKVMNPVDMTRLPINTTFQVNSPDFVLQFFFSGPDILGIIFKRNIKKPLFLKWCFFRSCEDSPFDYVSIIAQPNSPPLANGFFEIKLPPSMNYKFQGLHFFTRD